jgi:arsenate reductase (thioredoxin)
MDMLAAMQKRRVLFVCTHNSARSHMAEAMLRAWGGDRFEVFSAGTEATGIKPETIQVMEEIGISLDGHRSKTIEEFRGQSFEWFITVCDEAQKNCPVLPGVGQVGHWSVEDPSLAVGSAQERLAAFRRARDHIRDRLRLFILAGGRQDIQIPEPTVLR